MPGHTVITIITCLCLIGSLSSWLALVETVLQQSVGKVINTAFMERLNLSIRQHVAALTDHLWTMEELLLFRVPPWPQGQPLPG